MISTHILSIPVFFQSKFVCLITFPKHPKNTWTIIQNSDSIGTLIFSVTIIIIVLTAGHPQPHSTILEPQTITVFQSHHRKARMISSRILPNSAFYHSKVAVSATSQKHNTSKNTVIRKTDSIGIIIFNTIIIITILTTAHPRPSSNISQPQTTALTGRDILLCSRSDGLRLLLCVEGIVFSEIGCGIIGSPRSMDMVCPDHIGRDSWDRGGQEAVVWPDCNFPQNCGGRKPH